MDWTEKLYMMLSLRKAFVEGATRGKFGITQLKAEKAAIAKFPSYDSTTIKGELPEIAEAMRVPVPENAPRKDEGEDTAF